MNCKINLTSICDFTKKAALSIKKALTPVFNKLSDIYAEYDIDVNGKTHLTPEKTDETGNEQNVISTSCKGKIKLSAKDILCFLAVFAAAFSLLKCIARKILK